MSPPESAKIGQPSEPGEYDEAMLALLQIIWDDGFLSRGGADASGTFSRADFVVIYGQQAPVLRFPCRPGTLHRPLLPPCAVPLHRR